VIGEIAVGGVATGANRPDCGQWRVKNGFLLAGIHHLPTKEFFSTNAVRRGCGVLDAVAVQRGLSAAFNRLNVITQFVSQVLPSSSENVCSKRAESGVMSMKLFRTIITLSLNSS
jgi:hypothetical protein